MVGILRLRFCCLLDALAVPLSDACSTGSSSVFSHPHSPFLCWAEIFLLEHCLFHDRGYAFVFSRNSFISHSCLVRFVFIVFIVARLLVDQTLTCFLQSLHLLQLATDAQVNWCCVVSVCFCQSCAVLGSIGLGAHFTELFSWMGVLSMGSYTWIMTSFHVCLFFLIFLAFNFFLISSGNLFYLILKPVGFHCSLRALFVPSCSLWRPDNVEFGGQGC